MASESPRLRALDVAEAVRLIITCLDVETLEAMLLVLHEDASGRTYLHDNQLWQDLTTLHFQEGIPDDLKFLALPKKPRAWEWTDSSVAGSGLQEFLRIVDERDHFRRTVSIVRGDIGKITVIDGTRIDGLAFPTNSHLSNHFMGAASAIFRRAGKGLSDLVSDPNFRRRRNVGDAVVTPAFEAGVASLIHCVGPRISQDDCFERLAFTYSNAMNAVLAEDLRCVAIASISTGSMGVPADLGAQFALRAIQKFIRANHWEGKVGIVCFEDSIFTAFKEQLGKVLAEFNATPPYPPVTPRMWLA